MTNYEPIGFIKSHMQLTLFMSLLGMVAALSIYTVITVHQVKNDTDHLDDVRFDTQLAKQLTGAGQEVPVMENGVLIAERFAPPLNLGNVTRVADADWASDGDDTLWELDLTSAKGRGHIYVIKASRDVQIVLPSAHTLGHVHQFIGTTDNDITFKLDGDADVNMTMRAIVVNLGNVSAFTDSSSTDDLAFEGGGSYWLTATAREQVWLITGYKSAADEISNEWHELVEEDDEDEEKGKGKH